MTLYLAVSLFTFVTTLISLVTGYVLGKSWLDKRFNVAKKLPGVKP